jgi:hypothetical protein
MAAQTVTIIFVSALPSTTSQVTVNVPAGIDWTQHIRNIFHAGGFNFVSATGVNTFIPSTQILNATNP